MNEQNTKVSGDQASSDRKILLLWPGIIIVLLQWIFHYPLPLIFPGTVNVSVLATLACGLALLIWWVFFSRATRFERWTGLILTIASLIGSFLLSHKSISTGMQGMMFFVYAVPITCLTFIIWAIISRYLKANTRRISMMVAIVAGSGIMLLFRSGGMTGQAEIDIKWRWTKTAEEKLLEKMNADITHSLSSDMLGDNSILWPGFRGIHRDAIIHNVRIETNWSEAPPRELWRRPIGPGCSSFAVRGNLVYTQEQRGEYELVSCYHLKTGDPIWYHEDSTRFWDSHAGAGPRGTPSIKDGFIYTLGATGILNVLDALDGSLQWTRNTAEDTGVKPPGWGFTSSPLILDEQVIIALAGTLVSYDIQSGAMLWKGSDGGEGYSSPHLVTIDGEDQVLLMSKKGIISVAPEDGKIFWEHLWEEARIVQPAIISGNDLLLSAGGIKGIRRVSVFHQTDSWNVSESWTSEDMKPNFNDIVIHKGYAFGFNGPLLTCIDISTGDRQWRGGRFGGQLLLLADQDLLLILSEKGELALVEAIGTQFREIARIPAIEGKTWNHPALVDDILLVRNSQEMAAFKLSLVNGR